MYQFIQQLKTKNETLFNFGLICMLLAFIFLLLTKFTTTQVYNANAWYKPFKFAFSIGLYALTMAWYCSYLPTFNIKLFNWTVILMLGFEIIYIAIQANKGELSHYNISTPIYSALYALMAIAASVVTVYTAYIGYLFFVESFPTLPSYYIWAIRLGIIIFVVFSFEGFVMGSRLSHTIGGQDGEASIPFLHWSTKYGDPRIAHFIGMHALQVLPILAYYFFQNTKSVFIISILYGMLAIFTLVQALQGKPLFKAKQEHDSLTK
jgi:hypothetical protein